MACNNTLTGAALDCGNVGGLSKIYISPVEDVTLIDVNAGEVTGITMASGQTFSEFSFRTGNANFVSTANRDDKAGTSFVSTVVSLQINNMSKSLRTEMTSLLKGNFYVMALDNNGTYWFIGYGSYASGSGTGQTGATRAEANMYNITLTAETNEYPLTVTALAVTSATSQV